MLHYVCQCKSAFRVQRHRQSEGRKQAVESAAKPGFMRQFTTYCCGKQVHVIESQGVIYEGHSIVCYRSKFRRKQWHAQSTHTPMLTRPSMFLKHMHLVHVCIIYAVTIDVRC